MSTSNNNVQTGSSQDCAGIRLADLINHHPLRVGDYDPAVLTHYYDPDYVDSELMRIAELDAVDWLVDYITISWQVDVDSRRQQVVRYDPASRNYEPYVGDLPARLTATRERIHHRDSLEKKRLEMLLAWQSMQGVASATAQPSAVAQEPPFRVDIASLPAELQPLILVSQEVFDAFVRRLNGETWTIVTKSKEDNVDALRFLCNFHRITDRATTRKQFDTLLHFMVKALHGHGSLVSSMTRMKLTQTDTIERCYLCYACANVNHDMQEEIKPLWDACQPLEKSLKPVLDMMNSAGNH